MKEIALSKGYVAIVDDEDFDLVNAHKWVAQECMSKRGGVMVVYATRQTKVREGGPKKQYMHRLIMGLPYGLQVDHIDRNGLNNTRQNLRACTKSQNMQNQAPIGGKSSRYKGVYWFAAREKWQTYINMDGKRKSLGYFTEEDDAARAYDAAAKRMFGEFARLNIPE